MKNWGGSGLDRVFTAILAVAILAGIGAISYTIANPGTQEVFTEFYLLGPDGKAYGYPSELKVGEEGSSILGIVNQEHRSMSYQVELISGGDLYEEMSPITLTHGETWQQEVRFALQKPGKAQMIQFLLYKIRTLGNEQNKHTSLSLWLGRENLKAVTINTGSAEAAYEIRVRIDARLTENDKSLTELRSLGSAVVAPGEEWKLAPEYVYPEAVWQNAEFLLYRDGKLIYREKSLGGYPELHLLINVTGSTG